MAKWTGLQKGTEDQTTTNSDKKQLHLKDHGKHNWQDSSEGEYNAEITGLSKVKLDWTTLMVRQSAYDGVPT